MRGARAWCALFWTLTFAAGALPARSSASTGALQRYLRLVASEDYARAFASLDTLSRNYYGNERNYASWFRALHVRLRSFTIASRANGFVADERLRMFDPAQSRDAGARRSAHYSVTRERGTLLVRDLEHPRQTFTPAAQATVDGARIAVDDVEVYPSHIAIRMTLRKTDPGFITFLPYNKTVLTDQDDRVYPLLVSRDWRVTDKALFLGMRLAGNAQYSGTMRFRIPGGAAPRELHLEVAPAIREEGRMQPFAVTLPPMKLVVP